MRQKYYKITGLDEGVPITPYGVTLDQLDSALYTFGDMSRHHEAISFDEYVLLANNGISPMFSVVVNKLIEGGHSFMVENSEQLTEDDPLKSYMPEGRDTNTRFIYVQLGNAEYIIYDYDTETLTNFYVDLCQW